EQAMLEDVSSGRVAPAAAGAAMAEPIAAESFDLLVLGGGPAGVTAALRGRELGATVALVERDQLGGTCTNDGCAPTRVLAKAARLARDAEQYAAFGLEGRPPRVDLAELLARAQERVYQLHEKKQLEANLAAAGARVYSEAGRVRFRGPHQVELGNGRRLAGASIIICVGGHARRLTFPGSELALTHSDIWALKRLPAGLAVIGGAATGCQLASIFAAFGTQVTILDVAERILGGEEPAVAEAMTAAFEARRVRVVTGIGGVERLERAGDGLALTYRAGAAKETLACQLVVQAVGWLGNLEGLNLEAAGVRAERGYIQVDASLRTSAPHIFAAGDVDGRMMLVQSATLEGALAAENAVLGQKRAFEHRVVPHGGFTDPEYGSVGLTEREATEGEPSLAALVAYAELDRAVIDGRPEGFCKLVVSRASGRILGAHVVGEQAVEVVQVAAAGMAAGMQVQALARLELAYPTYAAILGLAARRLARELELTPLAPTWHTLPPVERRPAEWERAES
ncbi:MAG: dihydrolipoyl dehydrogenase family protein, partial [Candidatus Promineifilaceae bacterium]